MTCTSLPASLAGVASVVGPRACQQELEAGIKQPSGEREVTGAGGRSVGSTGDVGKVEERLPLVFCCRARDW